jgi:hypothetical protein
MNHKATMAPMALQKAIIELVNHISSYLSLIGREKKSFLSPLT